MTIKALDTVVLMSDRPEHGLKRGDIGAVVQIRSLEMIEVEFNRASGHRQALVTLGTEDVRRLSPRDLPAVRELDAA